MCYAATDAFVLVFSIRDPNSLHAVKNKFLREIESYREANPRRNVPIILVGQHAECRSNPAFAAQAVSSQDVVTFAHDVGILKYIEIHSNNLRHVNEVFRQLVLAVDQARNINTSVQSALCAPIVHSVSLGCIPVIHLRVFLCHSLPSTDVRAGVSG